MKSLKEHVHQHCLALLTERIAAVQSVLDEIAASITNETKSTAGDKYETARAMLHIEQENVSRQLQVLAGQKSVLERIDKNISTGKAGAGSLVKTGKGFFYLSIPLSKITVDGIAVVALSPESPLGKKLTGCSVHDVVEFNGASYTIEGIE